MIESTKSDMRSIPKNVENKLRESMQSRMQNSPPRDIGYLLKQECCQNEEQTAEATNTAFDACITGCRESKGVWYDRHTNEFRLCKFCALVRGFIAHDVVYEDKNVVIVLPLNPAVEGHLLIIPREHISTIDSFSVEHLPLLLSMKGAVENEIPGSDYQFYFHTSSFSSVSHVHLHALPIGKASISRWIKFTPGTWWCRSFQEVYDNIIKAL